MDSLVLSNIRQRPMRTLISVAAVGVEVTLVLIIVGLTSGMLQDIGKLKLDSDLLDKTTSLSRDEFERVLWCSDTIFDAIVSHPEALALKGTTTGFASEVELVSFIRGLETNLGRAAMLNGGLRAERHAILARVVEAIGETCNFTMLDGDAVVYLDRVEAAWPLRMTLSSGSRVPLHCTASGKLLLAMLPKASRARLIGHLSLARYTETTITDQKRLAEELARIRAQKYATDNEEFHAGLVCVAVPVADPERRVWAAVAVHAPASRMPLAKALEHLPSLRRAAVSLGESFLK